jgi:hypothetical protein
MWSYAVLRQLTESTRQQTRARQWTSGDRIGATGGALVVLLSRRGLRRILSGDACFFDPLRDKANNGFVVTANCQSLRHHESLPSSVASSLGGEDEGDELLSDTLIGSELTHISVQSPRPEISIDT